MQLCDYLTCDIVSQTSDGVIRELVQTLADHNKIQKENVEKITNIVIEREKRESTVVAKNIAVPHGKCEIDETLGVIGKSKDGEEVMIEYENKRKRGFNRIQQFLYLQHTEKVL
jgi:mannitol/fructose-specific phosphotransferase system IIA component (Ntr-type)